MINTGKRLLASLLIVAMVIAAVPMEVAAGTKTEAQPDYYQADNGYLSMKVSTDNGGFLIDTVEGDKLNKSDNNKFLLYPDENYDTSFTSFRVTRGDKVKDYIFGRDYGFLGMNSSDVVVTKRGNSVLSEWSVDGLVFTQTLTLLNQDAPQHGMVYITYSVDSIDDRAVDKVEARILLDTALGYQDYGIYKLLKGTDYETIEQEKVVEGSSYDNILFAHNNSKSPSITAYSVNATVDNKMVQPTKVAFGHWNNLASTKFDFFPDKSLTFTNPVNAKYRTADSAYAMYYDMGSVAASGSGSTIGTYYGVYSNVNIAGEDRVSLNFRGVPLAMELKEDQRFYNSQLSGGRDGDFEVTTLVKNITDKTIDWLALAVYPQNGIYPYDENDQLNKDVNVTNPYYQGITNLEPGEERPVTFKFNAEPLKRTDHRKIDIKSFDLTGYTNNTVELKDNRQIGTRSLYVLCPGTIGDSEVSFLSTSPEVIHTEGNRILYLAGYNFNLLRDKSQYDVKLRPISGGDDIVMPGDKFILNIKDASSVEDDTATLLIDQDLAAGTWQVIVDWTDPNKEDLTGEALRFVVSDDDRYQSASYGILTVEKNGRNYSVKTYANESDYNDNDNVLLEFRGDFIVNYTDGKLSKATAVSLETVDRKASSTINISDSLDIEKGTVTIEVKNPGKNNQSINTDIEGVVYTTGARTKVWNGVCALTSIKNGEDIGLLQYSSRGELDEDNEPDEVITLLWPGAASGAQTIAGLLFNFRYCEFAQVEKSNNTKQRAVAFGAQLSPDFLVPSNFKWSDQETSTLEKAQLKLASSNYTPGQLRDVQERYSRDQAAWEKASAGSLNLYVENILFGGGFIGFNAYAEIGLPSYAEGLPSIEGSLRLVVMHKEWEFAVAGSADLAMMKLHAELELRSYNGIPVPNKVYFFVSDLEPGINVDGHTILWIKGGGAGLDNIYETIFPTSYVPPITLMLSTQLSLFNVLTTEAHLEVSPRHISAELRNISVAKITVIDSMYMKLRWYPQIYFKAGIEIDIYDAIVGEGYLLLEQTDDGIFWEGFANAKVKIPDDIWIIGGIVLGNAEVGINQEKLWAALRVLRFNCGITYYWGGDVDFAMGKHKKPISTQASGFVNDIPVAYDEATGRTLYMSIDNSRLIASNNQANIPLSMLTASTDNGISEILINSDATKTIHTFNLGTAKNEDGLLSVSYPASSRFEAQSKAKELSITYGNDDAKYDLTFYDKNYEADAPENKDANTLVNWNSKEKLATIAISFTDNSVFNKRVTVKTSSASDLMLYGMERMADLTSVSYDKASNMATVEGDLDRLSKLAVYAVDQDENTWLVHHAVDTSITGIFSPIFPGDMPSGQYTLKAVGTTADQSSNPIVDSAEFSFVNTKQPEELESVEIMLGGDYSIDVKPTGNNNYDGYITTIYEEKGGQYIPTAFKDITYAKENSILPTKLIVGGQHSNTEYLDSNGNIVAAGTEGARERSVIVGLEAGKTYKVGVSSYNYLTDDKGNETEDLIASKEFLSSSIVMVEPTPTKVNLKANNSKAIDANYMVGEERFKIDTVKSSDITVSVTSEGGELGSGQYSLDDGEFQEWTQGNGAITFSNLDEGKHVLTFRGENVSGDAVQAKYQFAVDTLPPRLMINSPLGGGFYESTLTIEGLSDDKAKIHVLVEGETPTHTMAKEDGSFSVNISMDTSVGYQNLIVYTEDEMGNLSRPVTLQMTNKLLGNQNKTAGIYLDDKEITNSAVPEGTEGQLSFRVKVKDNTQNKVIAINQDSYAGGRINWALRSMQGSASLSETGYLKSNNGDYAMFMASLDQLQAAAILGDQSQVYALEDFQRYTKELAKVIEANYTVESWIIYKGIVDSNVVTANNTPGEINRAIDAITAAQKNLVLRIDGNLDAAKDAASKKVEANYTTTSWQILINALAMDESSSNEKVAKTIAINNAIDNLVTTVKAAEQALAEAKAIAASKTEIDYTLESWQVLTDALAMNEISHDEKVAKTKAINKAIDSLITVSLASNPTYRVAIPSDMKNGNVIVSPANVRPGMKATLSVIAEEGYILDQLSVVDARGNIIALNKESKDTYSFIMPATTLKVVANFVEKPDLNFTDVSEKDYFKDAVDWAVRNGITDGISDTKFGPHLVGSRAEALTFLWRAMGKPEPTGTVNPFRDIKADDYYYKAVLWAVENGITAGTSDDAFSPEGQVIRSQIMTFQWRAAGKPLSTKRNPFTDVDSSDYFADAVDWAVEQSITKGTSKTTFGSAAPSTRAQTITMLYNHFGR